VHYPVIEDSKHFMQQGVIMKPRLVLIILAVTLLLTAVACVKKEDEAAKAAAAEAEQLQAQIQQQEAKIYELQEQVQAQQAQQRMQEEAAALQEQQRLKDEIAKQQAELQTMKKQLAQKKAAAAKPAGDQPAADTGGTAAAPPPVTDQPAMAGQPAGATPITEAAQPAQPVEPPKPKTRTVEIPAGTSLVGLLQGSLSTKTNAGGDSFEMFLAQPVDLNGAVILPANTRLAGRVLESAQSGKVRGKAFMSLTVESVEIRGEMVGVQTNSLQFEAEGSTTRDAAVIGGGAGVGAIIGGIAGGKKGAAIGAVIGGGAGTAGVLVTRGKEVEFPPETKFQFQLAQPVKITEKVK